MNIRKLTTMAMLTAISMIVFLIEAQIPLPIAIPGVKLGIANVITLCAVCNDHDIVPAVLTLIAQGAGLLQGIGSHHLAVLGDLHHGAGLAVEGKGDQTGHTRHGDEADEQKPETKGFA